MKKKTRLSRLPKAVVIRKKLYEIQYPLEIKNYKGDQLSGECSFRPRLIKVALDTREEMESTLIHEILHAIAFEYKIQLPESRVLALEKGLYELLLANKVRIVFQ